MARTLSFKTSFIVMFLLTLSCAPMGRESVHSFRLFEERADEQFELKIDPSVAGQIDGASLRDALSKSVVVFQSDFSKLIAPIKVSVGGSGCLRTGYNFENKTVQFCKNEKTSASGTASVDVIYHEMFHAMICQLKSNWCTAEFLKEPRNVALQEALADLFAYHINPDELFGENFYIAVPHIRRYRSDACFNLVDSPYGRASTLVTFVLNHSNAHSAILNVLNGDVFSVQALGADAEPCFRNDGPALQFKPENYPESALSRYKISPNQPLVLKVISNDSMQKYFPEYSVELFAEKDIFSISQENGRIFIAPKSAEGWTKAIAQIRSGKRILGSQVLYFSIVSKTK